MVNRCTHFIFLVPKNALNVTVEVSETGPVEAGSENLTLKCAVNEVIDGLSMDDNQWSSHNRR